MKISKHIYENQRYIEKTCCQCADVFVRNYEIPKFGKCLLIYLETTMNTFELSDLKPLNSMGEVLSALMAGNAVLFREGDEKAYKISSQGYPRMGVSEARMEKVLRGSQEGFSDSVKTNVALVRKRLRTPSLKVEESVLGDKSNTSISMVYLAERVSKDLLNEVRNRLSQVKIDGILDSGMIEKLAEEKWYSPFPRFQTTERPDRAAQELLHGRILILVDNSPVGLLLPTTFHNYLEASEDAYNRKEIVTFTKALRFGALLIAMMLSGLYLAVTTFHTQILPTHLVLSFSAARQGIPFSGIMEVLLMELAFELIREAGIRMPGPLGGTIGIVGGLIIGDAAVSANLVSPIVVIIVALTALGSFAIPNEEFSATFRVLKYGFIFLGGFLGLFGIVLGLFVVLEHLAGLSSFKIPYMMPYICKEYKEIGKE